MAKKLIVVCGMHRSGTSALARGMLALGARMGDSLLPPSEGNNSKGFWEDVDVVNFNDEVLSHIGMTWKTIRSVSQQDVEKLSYSGYVEKGRNLILDKTKEHKIYALKDPRISKLGLFWRVVFELIPLDIYYVVSYRNPLSVAASLRKRDGLSMLEAMFLWADHMLGAEKLIKGRVGFFSDYDYLMHAPPTVIRKIADAFGLEINDRSLQNYAEDFLDSSLRHTIYSSEDLEKEANVPSIVKCLYKIVCDRQGCSYSVCEFPQQPVIDVFQGWYEATLEHAQSSQSLKSSIKQLKRELANTNEQLRLAQMSAETARNALSASEVLRNNESIAMKNSMSWRVTGPLRRSYELVNSLTIGISSLANINRYFAAIARAEGGSYAVLKLTFRILRNEGVRSIFHRIKNGIRVETHNKSVFFTGKNNQIKSTVSSLPLNNNKRVAVHIHAYYPDVVPSLLNYIGNMPCTCVLYISVPDLNAKSAVLKCLRSSRLSFNVDVRVVPNRGRDIAPFLCEFGSEWSKYDYVAHIHTKKSLYTGSEQTEWREYLLNALFGSEAIISRNISILDGESKVGFIYPETYVGLPYWAHTWLGNREVASGLARRLGISLEKQRYIDAPMGSMFWCRTDSLQPLIQLQLQFSDFPAELGQKDGTLAHAIERLFPQVVNASGYAYAVIQSHHEDASIYKFRGNKNLYQYMPLEDRLMRLLSDRQVELLTVDIFDTLLVRGWLYPSSVMSYLSELVKIRYEIQSFHDVRVDAENSIRNQLNSTDPSIDDIYQKIEELIGRNGDIEAIKELEIAIELRSCYLVSSVVHLLDYVKSEGVKISLVSDMYLTPSLIRLMLGTVCDDLGVELHVSCEANARKDTGEMWKLLKEKYSVNPDKWIHLGDNEHSDVQILSDTKIALPVHVLSHVDQYLHVMSRCEAFTPIQSWSESLLHGLVAKKLFIDAPSQKMAKVDLVNGVVEIHDLRVFGYAVIGPILASFMSWLLAAANRDGIKNLLYASREGFLLAQAHDILSKSCFDGDKLIPRGRYMLTSRVVANLVAIDGGASFESVMSAHFEGSFLDFINGRLGILNYDPYIDILGEERCFRKLSLFGMRSELLTMLEHCGDLIRAHAFNQRIIYKEYIEGLSSGEPFALVDIGYAGTIQRQLSAVSKLLCRGYYFVTTATDSDLNGGINSKMNACFAENISPTAVGVGVYKYHLLLESILTSPDEQFCRFHESGTPEFRAAEGPARDFSSVAEVQGGALDYLQDVVKLAPELFLSFWGARNAANLSISAFSEGIISMSDRYGLFKVEDRYSGNKNLSVLDLYRQKYSAQY